MGRTVLSSFHFIERPEKGRGSPRSYRAGSERKPNLSAFYHPGCLILSRTDGPVRRGHITGFKFNKLSNPKRNGVRDHQGNISPLVLQGLAAFHIAYRDLLHAQEDLIYRWQALPHLCLLLLTVPPLFTTLLPSGVLLLL